MTAHTISKEKTAELRKAIDAATADRTKDIPGFVAVVVNKEGQEIFAHASGKTGSETKSPCTLDSIFWIASCTKMIAGLACMQLVEQGVLDLDSADQAEKYCPELKAVKILEGFDDNDKPILKEKKNRITLRMLLTHTAGFGYTFFHDKLRKWGASTGLDEFSGSMADLKDVPILFEPGTNWQYGTNIDWAGIILERATGMSLNDYCHEHIFKPLNLQNISFFPTADMKSRLMALNQRYPDGHMTQRPHLMRRSLITTKGHQEQIDTVNSGGAGAFARPQDYTQIIATLLNNGTSPTTGARLLNPSTVDEMFRNQIPQFPNFARVPTAAAIPELTNPIPEFYPQPQDQPQGWGLTFMLTITPGPTGRGANTAWWAGLMNAFWWCDREKGVGGMVASQILPFGDAKVMGLWEEIETSIYN